VTFFEQRLVFGATNNNPQTLWFSKNGDYENFTTGTGDDDALVYTIASNQVNAIRYLSATRVLTIGTTGGEYVLTATSDGPVTPTTTPIRKYSNYGSAAVEPVQVADVTLFVQRGGRKVREFRYVGDINVSAYQAPDITIVAEHITAGGLSAFAYQQEPDGVIWADPRGWHAAGRHLPPRGRGGRLAQACDRRRVQRRPGCGRKHRYAAQRHRRR
jgi:hypothetical protein